MDRFVISIAQDFSETPAGRYKKDSSSSGQQFREDLLVPALRSHDCVEVNFDGTLGFGSSFLEEAFGGLVRIEKFAASDLRRRLVIRSNVSVYEKRVWQYIDEEDARR